MLANWVVKVDLRRWRVLDLVLSTSLTMSTGLLRIEDIVCAVFLVSADVVVATELPRAVIALLSLSRIPTADIDNAEIKTASK